MPLRKVPICQADADAAKYDMFHHCDPLAQKRALCLWLKFLGFDHQAIARVLDCNRATVGNYLTRYAAAGYAGLLENRYAKPQSALVGHRSSVTAAFRAEPPRSVKEAAQRIEDLTGVKRSLTRVRTFLHRLGMQPRQTGQVPAKADPDAQQQFHDQTLQPLLERAQQGACHVLFLDSAHFVLQAFVAIVWCFERVFLKTAPGRFRFNVLGALHAVSQQLTVRCNTTYITATTVIALLQDLALEYAGKPIFIVLDNARYQRCAAVTEAAQRFGIQLVFLPPYSPNLNLIERLWKFIKAKVCAARYYPDAQSFRQALVDCLTKISAKAYQADLETRLTLNFQLFNHAKNLAA